MNELGIDDSPWIPRSRWNRAAVLALTALIGAAVPEIVLAAAGVALHSLLSIVVGRVFVGGAAVLIAFWVRVLQLERRRLALRAKLSGRTQVPHVDGVDSANRNG